MKYLFTYVNHQGYNRHIVLDLANESDIYKAFEKAVPKYNELTGIYRTKKIY